MAIRIELTDIDRTVAMAAPSIPILKPNMNMGSKMIFPMTPVRVIVMDFREKPEVLMALENVKFRLVSRLPGISIFR